MGLRLVSVVDVHDESDRIDVLPRRALQQDVEFFCGGIYAVLCSTGWKLEAAMSTTTLCEQPKYLLPFLGQNYFLHLPCNILLKFSTAAWYSLVAAGALPLHLSWPTQWSSPLTDTRRHSNVMPLPLLLPLLNEYVSVCGSEATQSNHDPMRALCTVRFCQGSVAIALRGGLLPRGEHECVSTNFTHDVWRVAECETRACGWTCVRMHVCVCVCVRACVCLCVFGFGIVLSGRIHTMLD